MTPAFCTAMLKEETTLNKLQHNSGLRSVTWLPKVFLAHLRGKRALFKWSNSYSNLKIIGVW